MFLITAAPMGRPLYLNEQPRAASWVSNPEKATHYPQRADASRAYARCMARRDWPQWARFAEIVEQI